MTDKYYVKDSSVFIDHGDSETTRWEYHPHACADELNRLTARVAGLKTFVAAFDVWHGTANDGLFDDLMEARQALEGIDASSDAT